MLWWEIKGLFSPFALIQEKYIKNKSVTGSIWKTKWSTHEGQQCINLCQHPERFQKSSLIERCVYLPRLEIFFKNPKSWWTQSSHFLEPLWCGSVCSVVVNPAEYLMTLCMCPSFLKWQLNGSQSVSLYLVLVKEHDFYSLSYFVYI